MKYLIVVLAFVLSACSNSYEPMDFPQMPPELKDCKVYLLSNSGGTQIKVVYCPGKSTTTSTYAEGKHNSYSAVITEDSISESEKIAKLEEENAKLLEAVKKAQEFMSSVQPQ